ncbi:hypothetical protein [Prauserella muralis]|uniref:Uncharacterized protein n=1 Tax=Prauserella muralis TaxID=588067 RepID=A0A2V4AQM2_9PSEU|nr:hypothetical protein [Prauserella muralis]PXY22897.1 hypothetical protein BAY60_20230 [Prauserella muralis]TWE27849.1 hypothetical protein FHX69_0497 [Prauserella muralis]
MARHSVVLVRQWDQQMGGSGCCGRLDGEAIGVLGAAGAEDPYAHCRDDMERTGAVYRALRERFADDEVELTVADPRNTAWLLPAVWRAARRRGLPWRVAARQVVAATGATALVCDGLVLGRDVTPEQAVAAVEADLAAR